MVFFPYPASEVISNEAVVRMQKLDMARGRSSLRNWLQSTALPLATLLRVAFACRSRAILPGERCADVRGTRTLAALALVRYFPAVARGPGGL